jgi:hypothetical protein
VLDDTEIERFARQIVVPGIGADGQERICSVGLVIVGEPAGARLVETYARAAGFAVGVRPPACVLVAGSQGVDADGLSELRALGVPILWYRLHSTHIEGGMIAPGQPLDLLLASEAPVSAPASGRHALAAADLVAHAIGLVLGWSDVETTYTLDLA